MDLSTLIKTAKGRYGLPFSTTEDPVFTDAFLWNLANSAHRWAAQQARFYRQTDTEDLPVGTDGLSVVSLNHNVIDIVPGTVRVSVGGTWVPLEPIEEDALREELGPFENAGNGTPRYFFLRSGDALAAHRLLCLYPGATDAVVGGVRVDVWIHPVLMDEAGDTPAIQPGEHDLIVADLCRRMAEVEASSGRGDAPLAYWRQESEAELRRIKEVMEGSRRSGTRRIHMEQGGDRWLR